MQYPYCICKSLLLFNVLYSFCFWHASGSWPHPLSLETSVYPRILRTVMYGQLTAECTLLFTLRLGTETCGYSSHTVGQPPHITWLRPCYDTPCWFHWVGLFPSSFPFRQSFSHSSIYGAMSSDLSVVICPSVQWPSHVMQKSWPHT